jgi:hypothetical protein
MDIGVAVGTWALAVGTWVLVFVTYRQAREQLSQVDRLTKQQLSLVEGQLSTARAQVKINLYLELRKAFDSELVDARKLLARQLLDSTPLDAINEPVADDGLRPGPLGVQKPAPNP